ncbi:MAG TPA: hypothetical protein VE487_16485, partial [Ilumatobacter sp.]|nr:hypothetical protein [Ilumatobacter sp.]
MQEFTSISVSSYEADTLTSLLNEKSGDGWNVVTIVPTGSTVTAYLSRDKSEGSAEDTPVAAAGDKGVGVSAGASAGTAATSAAQESQPVIDPVNVAGAAAVTAAAHDRAASDEDEAEEPTKSPVDEPGGWAAGHAAAGAGAV